MDKSVVLIVMDGIGLNGNEFGNAVKLANTPTLDSIMKSCPFVELKAHGAAVGLPSDDDMGNSEVGHNALGCGQIYSQGAKLVNRSIKTGEMFTSKTWNDIVVNCLENNSTLHFIGLLSDGNVHSNVSHLKAMIRKAQGSNIGNVRIHILLDGRDVPATSALEYVNDLEALLSELNNYSFCGKIASGGGRMKITMDRYEADWDMVKAGWETHICGQGRQFSSASEAITVYRQELNCNDQDLPAFIIAEKGNPVGKILDGDSVILFNFRGDRAIELSTAFDSISFDKFDRKCYPNVLFAGMLQYDGDLGIPRRYLVNPPEIKNTLTEYLVGKKVRSYAVSETQKFGHVTYFWNGNRIEKFSDELETYHEIPSDKGFFDRRPWMKCADITDKIIEAVESGKYDFIRANFPNGDMVGHTGDFDATVIAVEAVDLCLARIINACEGRNISLIITADHGNADQMYEPSNNGEKKPRTAHSLNKVPFIIIDRNTEYKLKQHEMGLANVAATVAEMLGFEKNPVWKDSIIENTK